MSRFRKILLIEFVSQAAIRAGYKAGNAQKASEIETELLQKNPVSEAIQQAMDERYKRTGIALYVQKK